MSTVTFDSTDFLTDPGRNADKSESAGYTRDWVAVKDVLVDYVQPNTALSLNDAVDQVAQFWHYRHDARIVAALRVPIALAEQIPYGHPAHQKLAEFMLAFYDQGKWIAESASQQERESEQRNMWSLFNGELYDGDWRTEGEVDKREDNYHPTRYPNFCAFAANIVNPAGYPERFCYALAKHAFADAAELSALVDQDIRDARVLGAAQYIIFRAETIFDEVVKLRRRIADFEADQSHNCFSKLLNRKRRLERHPSKEFEWEEWQTWKEVLRKAARDETHGRECREVAQRAVDLMVLQEKIEENRSAGS